MSLPKLRVGDVVFDHTGAALTVGYVSPEGDWYMELNQSTSYPFPRTLDAVVKVRRRTFVGWTTAAKGSPLYKGAVRENHLLRSLPNARVTCCLGSNRTHVVRRVYRIRTVTK